MLSRTGCKAFLCGLLISGPPASLLAQGVYTPLGSEYPVTATLPGDQVHPCLALTTNGGFLAWEDNITDGYGLGISAQRLDSGFSPSLAPFRVNATAAGDQENVRVSLLSGGGAAFVWQGGAQSFQHIYARFLSSSNTWLTSTDIVVNAVSTKFQSEPSVATLRNGNIVIVYSSLNQQGTNSLKDVYAQVLSPTGQKIGGEFLVNQFTTYNQRSPVVAGLVGGGFVIAWVSEQERSGNMDNPNANYLYGFTNQASVDVFARIYNATNAPITGELLVNSNWDVCANPSISAGTDGGFMVAWGARNTVIKQFSWDIFARGFSSVGVGGAIVNVNTYQYGDQYAPRTSALGSDYFITWTSLAQDGSREGVYGRVLRSDGTAGSDEMRINTTTMSQQIHPVVGSDGYSRFVVAWSSFIGGAGSFDLFAQRYINTAQPLLPMNPPFVYVPFTLSGGTYVPQIQVSWPLQTGLPIDHYELFVDGSLTPAALVTTNAWTLTGIAANSTHTFQIAYVTTDTRRSPLSAPSSATTWMGYSWYGLLPLEWMQNYFGWDSSKWPTPTAPLAPGGPTLEQVFLSGGNPLDSTTWLRTQLVSSPEGYFLGWNPRPGFVYQVQSSPDLSHWSNVGSPRFAAGSTDSIFVGVQNVGYFRVLLLR